MNRENLSIIFDQYINRFEELNAPEPGDDEGYKWRVESHFVKYWDVDADDFSAMFKMAMKEIEKTNLIDNESVHPLGGIRMLLSKDDEAEFVRQCFRELFTEDGGDLSARQERILSFINKINQRIEKYTKGSWKYPQKMNDVIYYLNLWRPWENYIFKSTEATNWANCIEFGDDFGSGSSFSLEKYYRMCDELLTEVRQNKEIMRLNGERFAKEAKGFDDKQHILVYDIIYCAHTYDFYVRAKAATTSTKERIKRAQLRFDWEIAKSRYEDAQENLELKRQKIFAADITGAEVTHKKFGTGKVVSHQNGMLVIAFPSGEKKFQYPGAIMSGFLTIQNEALRAEISREIQVRTELDLAEKEAKEAKKEYDRLDNEMNQSVKADETF